jgi:phosphate transport system substrate-binding protein
MANDESNGLKDLYAGRSDVAMVAAPIDSTERIINAAAPGSISTAGFQVAVIGSAQIKFVVNPANPVKALTSAQLKAIFTGAITNWKDLGGADQPIVVATGPVGMAARTNVVDGLLNGAEIVASAREIEGLNQIVRVVAEDPAAIGYGNAASITPGVSVIEGTEINETLGLATNGPPSPAVRKLIQAVMPFGAAMK